MKCKMNWIRNEFTYKAFKTRTATWSTIQRLAFITNFKKKMVQGRARRVQGDYCDWIMANYLCLFSLLSGYICKMAIFCVSYLLSFKGYRMCGRSLPLSGLVYVKRLVKIPIKILEVRVQCLLYLSWTRPSSLSERSFIAFVLGWTQLICLIKCLYFSL